MSCYIKKKKIMTKAKSPFMDAVVTKTLNFTAGATRGEGRTTMQRSMGSTAVSGSEERRDASMGPTQHAEAHKLRKGLKTWQRIRSRMEGQMVDYQQWLVEGNIPLVNHHVVVGLGQLGPQPTTFSNFQGPGFINPAARIHEIVEDVEDRTQGPERGLGTNSFNSSEMQKALCGPYGAATEMFPSRISQEFGPIEHEQFSEGSSKRGAKRRSLVSDYSLLKKAKSGDCSPGHPV